MKECMKCVVSCGSNRMTRCGIGPRFSIITVACAIVAGWLTYQYPAVFMIPGIAPWIFVVLGTVLVAGGMVLYMVALRTFNRGYRQNKLVTEGPYAHVRHPIYASWILLICPGVILFFRSWLMLLLPLVAYASFKVSINREDSFLEDRFGQAYRDYRARTNELLPFVEKILK